jgi:prepilin-type N-terminal cleavage/methylation domain-containing protein
MGHGRSGRSTASVADDICYNYLVYLSISPTMHILPSPPSLRQANDNRAFTLIELLVVIAVIAILAVVVVLVLNPAELLKQSRDANRLSDMATLTNAINLYNTDQSGVPSFSMGSSSVVYVSIADPAATSTLGDQCQGLGLFPLPANYTYHCAASSTLRNVDDTGWIPIDFKTISSGAPIGSLPIDPTNSSSSRLYYTYTTNGTQFELTMAPESAKYQLAGINDIVSTDGGTNAYLYEKGTNLALEPIDYGPASGLVGYWPLDEGTGTVVYDYSGNNATGSWSGTQAGTSGFYSPGQVQSWAGYFDGISDYIQLPDSTPLNLSNQGTVLVWVNPVGTYGDIVAKENTVSPYQGYGLYDWGGQSNAFIANASTNNNTGASSNLSTGAWACLTLRFDGSNVDIYVNGTLLGSVTQTINATPSGFPLRIGEITRYFHGLISDVRIYSRALSAAEIAALCDGGK